MTYGLEPARFLGKDAKISRGVKQIVPVANPGAGNEFTVTVPGGEQWFIYAGRLTFTASAAVANRTVTLAIEIDGFRSYQVADPTAVVANGQVFYNVIGSDSPVQAGNVATVGWLQTPSIPLSQGAVIHTVTLNLDVADQWQNCRLYVARVYLPDQKLDEIAELEQLAYFDAMRKAGLTQGA